MGLAVLSGQEALTSGTPLTLPDVDVGGKQAKEQDPGRVVLFGHPDNSGPVWIGDTTGTFGMSDGVPVPSDGDPIYLSVDNLSRIQAISEDEGDVICWLVEHDGLRNPII
jgi:hypothetical protein